MAIFNITNGLNSRNLMRLASHPDLLKKRAFKLTMTGVDQSVVDNLNKFQMDRDLMKKSKTR
jgi:hypothetical protein